MDYDESWDEGCVAPPGLWGDAIMAVVDGEADEAMLAHMRGCPACTARVERIRALQRTLRRQFYRLFCPSTDLLVDYCQGLLDPYQRAVIAHHVAICPYCAEEFALLDRNLPAHDLFDVVGLAHSGLRSVL